MRRSRCQGAALAAIMLGLAPPAMSQSLGGAQAPDVSMMRVAFAFVFCIAVAGAGAWVLRFRMTGRLDLPRFLQADARRLVLLERLQLGAHHELCLLAFDGREFMVSVSPAGLARFETPENQGDVATP